MPTKVLPGQAHLNIFWCDPITDEEEPVELGQLYEKSRPVGMLAMNLVGMIMEKTELTPDDFDLIMFDDPQHGAGFYLYPANSLDEDAFKDVEEGLREFHDYFEVYTDPERVLHRERDNCAFAFRDARSFLMAMVAAVDDDEALYTPADMEEDYKAHPEMRAQMLEKGKEALGDAWIYATMPEQVCYSEDALYELAFKTALAPLPVPLTDIYAAVKNGEQRHDQATPLERQMLAYRPNGLALH